MMKNTSKLNLEKKYYLKIKMKHSKQLKSCSKDDLTEHIHSRVSDNFPLKDVVADEYADAATKGQLVTIKFLEQHFSVYITQDVKKRAIYLAWEEQHLNMIEHLSPGEAFIHFCKIGRLNQLDGILKLADLDLNILREGYVNASYSGHLETMKTLEKVEGFELNQEAIENSLHWATIGKRLDVVKCLAPKLICLENLRKYFVWSIARNSLNLLEYYLTFPSISTDQKYLAEIIHSTAKDGLPEMLDCLLKSTEIGKEPKILSPALEVVQKELEYYRVQHKVEEGDIQYFHVKNLIETVEILNLAISCSS